MMRNFARSSYRIVDGGVHLCVFHRIARNGTCGEVHNFLGVDIQTCIDIQLVARPDLCSHNLTFLN